MMGLRVNDPLHVEGPQDTLEGLGLLPVVSEMGEEKVVCQSDFLFRGKGPRCKGYQIHMGRTQISGEGVQPLNSLPDGSNEGCWAGDSCWGTYMHGILDNPVVLDALAADFGFRAGTGFDYAAFKEEQYNRLAALVREAVDMDYIYSTLQL